MKILVTGSEGFIGKHLVKRLQDEGHEVDGYDARCSQDVRNTGALYEAMIGKDVMFHLAAAHLTMSLGAPMEDLITNGCGAINALEACKANCAKLIMAGTGSVHPQPNGIPGTPYGISKLAAEHYAQYYRDLRGVDVTILRYFSVYGPGMPTEGRGVIGIFCRAAVERMPIRIHGGQQQRAFCYVDDVVDANILALDNQLPDLVYEVGTSDMISIDGLAELVCLKYGRCEVLREQARSGDDIRMVADTASLRAMGWAPNVDLGTGIDRVYEWTKTFPTHAEMMSRLEMTMPAWSPT